MTFTYAREIVAAAWILTLLVVGVVADVRSVTGWTALTVIAVSSLLILRRFWRYPAQTMSESIQEARRN